MIDRRLLLDSVQIQLVTGLDNFGKEKYSDPVILSPVRFDRNIRTTGTGSNPHLNKSGVIFVYTHFCNVVVTDNWLNAKVIDGTRTYRVIGYAPIYHPLTNKVFSYEIEVV